MLKNKNKGITLIALVITKCNRKSRDRTRAKIK